MKICSRPKDERGFSNNGEFWTRISFCTLDERTPQKLCKDVTFCCAPAATPADTTPPAATVDTTPVDTTPADSTPKAAAWTMAKAGSLERQLQDSDFFKAAARIAEQGMKTRIQTLKNTMNSTPEKVVSPDEPSSKVAAAGIYQMLTKHAGTFAKVETPAKAITTAVQLMKQEKLSLPIYTKADAILNLKESGVLAGSEPADLAVGCHV